MRVFCDRSNSAADRQSNKIGERSGGAPKLVGFALGEAHIHGRYRRQQIALLDSLPLQRPRSVDHSDRIVTPRPSATILRTASTDDVVKITLGSRPLGA